MLLRHRPPELESQSRQAARDFQHIDEKALALLRWLGANRVEFVLVGPVAEAIRRGAATTGPVAIVPAPYGRNISRLCRALNSAHARQRIDVGVGSEPDTSSIKFNEEKLLRAGRWTLRCGHHDLDIENPPARIPGGAGGFSYQELLYEAGRYELAGDLTVEVASPDDLEHFAQLRRTGTPPEIRITRSAKQDEQAEQEKPAL